MPDPTNPDPYDLLQRLAAAEERLRQVEAWAQRLGYRPPRAAGAATERAPSPPTVVAPVPVTESAPPTEPIPVVVAPPPAIPPTGEPAVPPPQVPVTELAEERERGNLEQTIGLKWAGWVGAVVLVIGIGLGINFAHERGWFGRTPPVVQLLAIWLGGLVLLAAGEVVYRRVNVVSATGLFGAGVGVLFLASYSGCLHWELYGPEAAFLFALLTTLIGSGVAMRGKLVVIAVLAQIGGNLAPPLLSTGAPPNVPLLAYVFTLQVAALFLAWWGNTAKWWTLRVLSLATTAWWVFVCLTGGEWGVGLANEVLWFTFLSAMVFQMELLGSAYRSIRTSTATDGAAPGADLRRADREDEQDWGTVFSLVVTAGLTAVGLDVFYAHDRAELRGALTLILASLCLTGSLLYADRNPRVRALAVGYRVQAVGLVILFVPVTFTGVWVSLAWGILSLAFAVLGARFDRGLARGAALLTWALALGRLVLDSAAPGWDGEALKVWFTVDDDPVHAYTVLGGILALAGLTIAWLTQVDLRNLDRRADIHWWAWATGAAVVASFVWALVSLADLPRHGATLSLVAWAWLLIAGEYLPRPLFTTILATGVVVFAAWKWFFYDIVVRHVAPSWDPFTYGPLLNPELGLGLALAASLGAMSWRLRLALPDTSADTELPPSSAGWLFLTLAIVVATVTAALSFELDRVVRQVALAGYDLTWSAAHVELLGLTVLWSGSALLLAAIADRIRYATLIPLSLLIFLAAKLLLVDMFAMRMVHWQAPVRAVVLFNFQMATAVAVLSALYATARLTATEPFPKVTVAVYRGIANLLVLLIVLCAFSLEIDRLIGSVLADQFADPIRMTQAALTVFWSVFAVGTVILGFRIRVAGLRHFGLGLFAATLFKVALIDLGEVRYGYRILSFLGLGLLLLATSVLYGRLSPRLLGERNT